MISQEEYNTLIAKRTESGVNSLTTDERVKIVKYDMAPPPTAVTPPTAAQQAVPPPKEPTPVAAAPDPEPTPETVPPVTVGAVIDNSPGPAPDSPPEPKRGRGRPKGSRNKPATGTTEQAAPPPADVAPASMPDVPAPAPASMPDVPAQPTNEQIGAAVMTLAAAGLIGSR